MECGGPGCVASPSRWRFVQGCGVHGRTGTEERREERDLGEEAQTGSPGELWGQLGLMPQLGPGKDLAGHD
eukprot:2916815-Amphidinium_carterae.2